METLATQTTAQLTVLARWYLFRRCDIDVSYANKKNLLHQPALQEQEKTKSGSVSTVTFWMLCCREESIRQRMLPGAIPCPSMWPILDLPEVDPVSRSFENALAKVTAGLVSRDYQRLNR
eukprot:scaffold5529_cov117-Cylindrotheca_fusiformis.AAC.31